MNLQSHYDLEIAKDALGDLLAQIQPLERVVNNEPNQGSADPERGEVESYRMTTCPGHAQVGTNTSSMNQLADDLEDAGIMREQSQ